MKRRHFLVIAAGAVAVVAAWRGIFSSDQDAIVAIINKRLDYLKKDPEGVRQFAKDLAATHQIATGRLRIVSALRPIYARLSMSGENRVTNSIHHGEERVTSVYLLSSDFFQNGADINRVVRYTGIYNPLRACSNPFARTSTV